ncbi:MAG: TIM barrel protein [Lentisphaerae bacterium]|nr:TIM barrel protein [Lentisphaerota bacterium]
MKRALSVQLYSLREESKQDFPAVLKRVADIGYIGIEPAGFYGLKPAEFKKMVDDLGLKIFSSHSPWGGPDNLSESMDVLSELGLNNMVCGYGGGAFKDMDAIKESAEKTSKIYETLAQNGFTLFQHNHDWEFERLDGRLKYEIYAELCPNVKFQIDSFWSANSGEEDEVAIYKMFAPRASNTIHIKDGILNRNRKPDEPFKRIVDLRALGSGDLNIKGLVENLPPQVESIIVELDSCNIDMFTAIELSYKYMIDNGLAAGNK